MGQMRSLLLTSLLLAQIGCASWWGKKETSPQKGSVAAKVQSEKKLVDGEEPIRFSENPNIGAFNERRYRRVTRKSIEEESEVGSRAGSLWNTEGPSSYLFTQNKLHREGDLLNIKIEGNAKTQVDTKIQVIKKLLARLEIVPNSTDGTTGAPLAGEANANRGPAASNPPAPALAAGTPTAVGPINVESVPTRVTERMGDGNYRVKGQQSFMIGKKEFRVILTGLVRPEDFSDEGISSNKLLDPQLDVVSLRRSLQ
jgi:flagellar L-ring protein precursor FlgH